MSCKVHEIKVLNGDLEALKLPNQASHVSGLAAPGSAVSMVSEVNIMPGFAGFKQMETVSDIKDVYSFKKKLGSGSFGTVYSGRLLKTNTPIAIKTISRKKLLEKNKILDELLTEELRLLTILEHPHIVRALGLCEDEETVYVAFELMKRGTLTEILKKIREKNIDFTEADSANIIH